MASNLENLLSVQNVAELSIVDVGISLILAGILSWILSGIYIRYGTSLSNRKKFARTFMLLATTTTLVIAIVKSSLALSLGLVGALSIVRFRAAIKEPEELAYLFLNIGIGLGMGANQWAITTGSFVIIAVLIRVQSGYSSKEEDHNLYITISSSLSNEFNLKSIKNILTKYCSSVALKRFNKKGKTLEATFLVDFDSFDKLHMAKKELSYLSESANISYIHKEIVS